MSAHKLFNSFNAGELSPLMDARVDSEKYQFSCERLENFIPRIYGGAFRRPGMEWLGEVGDASKKVRLIPFNYSATTRFIIEIGEQYFHFWSNGLRVEYSYSPGTAVVVNTPYLEAELFEVQFVQLNDVAYFTHPNHPPYKLVRVADDDWGFYAVEWEWPPVKAENTEAVTLAFSGTSGSVTVTCSSPSSIFSDDSYEGTYIQVSHLRASSSVELELTATGNSSAIRILGSYDVFTYGTWTGELELQRENQGTWETLRSWKGAANRNIAFSGTQLEDGNFRLKYTRTSETGSPKAVIEAASSRVSGVIYITEVTSTTTATAGVAKPIYSTAATKNWAIASFNPVDGYPRAIGFHEQRLIFAGTEAEPSTFWGSTIGDFQNFQRTGYDDASFAFTLAAQEGSAIQSIVSHRDLVLLTQSEEWRAFTANDEVITPTNITVRRQSRFGSAYFQAFVANQSILFLQRGGRKLREFAYNAIEESSSAADLTLLAEHVTAGGIVQMAFQQQPDPILWGVTANGVLLSMTFERDQNVVGWSRHLTEGYVESVAVIYGDEGEADEVWLVVRRTIDGSSVRYVERLDPEVWVKLDDPATYSDQLIFSDSAIYISQISSTAVSGLDHLEGEAVAVLADGEVVEGLTVASGAITLPTAATKIVVGLPYTSILTPAKTEIQMPDGSAQGRKMLTRRFWLNLWKSAGVQYADNADAIEADWFTVTPSSEDGETVGGLFTGEVPSLNFGEHRNNVTVTIRQTKPLPANLLALLTKFDVYGN